MGQLYRWCAATRAEKKTRMAILLIGSTGNGKSTLGNFLVNPDNDHILGDKQTFRTARNNLPQTQTISTGEFQYEGQKVTVVDTPGLNESAWKDLRHMIDIVKYLRNLESVEACVLCTKFDAKIDDQYKVTIAYYSKLLPTLFEGNLIVVMTELSTDQRSVARRLRKGTDEEQMKENAIAEIKEIAGLSYRPQLFTIDCLPVEEDERKISMETRKALLDYIAQLQPISTADVVVAKTEQLKQIDDKEFSRIRGEIKGYSNRLKQLNDQAAETFTEIEKEQVQKFEVVARLAPLQAELKLKDSGEYIIAEHWSLSREWKLLKWLSEKVDISSQWKIANVKKWSNGHCDWKEEEQTEKRFKCKLQGNFMRGLYASLTLETTKRDKYAAEVAILHERESNEKKHLDGIEERLNKIRTERNEFLDEMSDLNQHLDACLKRSRALSTNYLSLEQAQDRLRSL